MSIKYSLNFILIIFLLCVLLLSSCAPVNPEVARSTARLVENKCLSYNCYMEIIGRNKHDVSINVDGNKVVQWHMSVTKTRPLEYGETARSGMHYEYYNEGCCFTAVFSPDGKVVETEWDGPGCWGRGG